MAVPGDKIVISGFGDPVFNGEYLYDGEVNGYPRWAKTKYIYLIYRNDWMPWSDNIGYYLVRVYVTNGSIAIEVPSYRIESTDPLDTSVPWISLKDQTSQQSSTGGGSFDEGSSSSSSSSESSSSSSSYVEPRLLNLYPGALAAYSLRLLDGRYSGPMISLRRQIDNDEKTLEELSAIYGEPMFDVNDFINETLIGLWAPSGYTYVTKLWDQSGNGYHMEQIVDTGQPRFSNNGAIWKNADGKISMYARGYDQFFDTPGLLGLTVANPEVWTFSVAQSNLATNQRIQLLTLNANATADDLELYRIIMRMTGYSGGWRQELRWNSNLGTGAPYVRGNDLFPDFDPSQMTHWNPNTTNAGTGALWRNGVSLATTSAAGGSVNIQNTDGGAWDPVTRLLYGPASARYTLFSEIVVYSTDQSGTRAGIEANQITGWVVT